MTNATEYETRIVRALDIFSPYVMFGDGDALIDKELAQVKKAIKHVHHTRPGSTITVGNDINTWGTCDISGVQSRTIDWIITTPKTPHPYE